MSVMVQHTFSSILKTKIYWVMLIFSILIISLVGYFSCREVIKQSSHTSDETKISREEVGKLMTGFPTEGCTGGGMDGGSGYSPEMKVSLIGVVQLLGFWMVTFFTNLASVFLMMGLIPNELSKRSIYTLIAKPLSRTDIFLGKLLGGWAAIFMFNLILGVCYIGFIYLAGAPFITKFLMVTVLGAIAPLLFGLIAFVLGAFFRSIAVGFFSMVILFFSSDGGNMMIAGVGKELLKWDKTTDFILTYLPPLQRVKVLVYNYIDYSIFQSISKAMSEFGHKVPSKWEPNVIFIAIYFAVILFVGWYAFSRKEFD